MSFHHQHNGRLGNLQSAVLDVPDAPATVHGSQTGLSHVCLTEFGCSKFLQISQNKVPGAIAPTLSAAPAAPPSASMTSLLPNQEDNNTGSGGSGATLDPPSKPTDEQDNTGVTCHG